MELTNNVIYFAKVRPSAIIPTRDEENAGYDIYANFEENELHIRPLETAMIPTGVASAMSNDWYLQVEERGSTGSKGIKKSAGVIDASYRGEIAIAITNATENKELIISKIANNIIIEDDKVIYPYSKAIAQLILHRVHNEVSTKEITFEELKNIPSNRGTGMLGSSGK